LAFDMVCSGMKDDSISLRFYRAALASLRSFRCVAALSMCRTIATATSEKVGYRRHSYSK
ncbi:hypothetical protein, partial [Cupriavidus pauculus]|uniref:hypothetical protein n=1 Tax=Cupriavidus pauculus TaxID=82633 RepID=UPI001C608ADD